MHFTSDYLYFFFSLAFLGNVSILSSKYLIAACLCSVGWHELRFALTQS
jgi:hypothetical protein